MKKRLLRYVAAWHRSLCAKQGHSIYTRLQCGTDAYVDGQRGAYWVCSECGEQIWLASLDESLRGQAPPILAPEVANVSR